jgi:hypothetical protein
VTAAEIIPADAATLERLAPLQREHAVTAYLATARTQLALAVEATGPAAVAALKAEIATAAEATKQLGLSREIQLDAVEMVRRAEYALGKAIRAGQERGEIGSRDNLGNRPRRDYERNGKVVQVGDVPQRNTSSPADFIPSTQERVDVYALSDDVAPAEFEQALTDAKDEGNPSRANVVRKIKRIKCDLPDEPTDPAKLTAVRRLARIRELAPTGYTSHQIAAEIGVQAEYVRLRAREHGIEIVADKVMGRSARRVDSNHIVQETVNSLEGLTVGIRLVNFDDLDREQAENWATSLTDSLRALNRLAKQIKEMTQ